MHPAISSWAGYPFMINYVERLMYAPTIDEAWKALTDRLQELGVPYAHYALARVLDSHAERLCTDVITLSNLEPELQDRLSDPEYVATAPTVRWLHEHSGIITWDWVRERQARGLLTSAEEKAFTSLAQSGFQAGYAIGMAGIAPRLNGGIAIYGPRGMTQDEMDRIWRRHGREIVALVGLAHMRFASLPSNLALDQLTPRQREALEWVSHGKSNQEIARIMQLSPATVEKHLRLARQALGVRTTAQAVILAMARNQIFIGDRKPPQTALPLLQLV